MKEMDMEGMDALHTLMEAEEIKKDKETRQT